MGRSPRLSRHTGTLHGEKPSLESPHRHVLWGRRPLEASKMGRSHTSMVYGEVRCSCNAGSMGEATLQETRPGRASPQVSRKPQEGMLVQIRARVTIQHEPSFVSMNFYLYFFSSQFQCEPVEVACMIPYTFHQHLFILGKLSLLPSAALLQTHHLWFGSGKTSFFSESDLFATVLQKPPASAICVRHSIKDNKESLTTCLYFLMIRFLL